MSQRPFADLEYSALSHEQQRVYDTIASGPRREVAGPLRIWLESPEFAEHAQALGRHVRYDSSLAPHLSELAILVTARIWHADFEWAHHAPLARDAGVPEAAIGAISRGERPAFEDPEMDVVFNFAAELHRDRKVADDTFRQAEAVLGRQRVVDLVGLCGYYSLISMTIIAFELPGGVGPRLPPIERQDRSLFR